MTTNPAYDEIIFERAQELMDLHEGTTYDDALQAARREMEYRR